jgi:energy-coupling factor transporter ATP-binding protein EcfA2
MARYRPRPSEREAVAHLWQFVQDRCPNTPGRRPWTLRDVEDKIRRAFATPIERPIDVAPKEIGLSLTPVLSIDRKTARFVPGMRLRVPEGTITVVTGQQGAGKGLLFVSEAAAVARQGGGVLIASDEDSAAHTIRPRLEVAAGEQLESLARIQMLSGLTLPEHVDELIQICATHQVRLLVVDPWTNHVGSIDVDKNQELRAALMALAEACDRTRMVALLIAHPNKNSENPDPLERVAHASALTQVARSAFWIVRDPREDYDEHARLVAHVKHNLTARADTIEYRIETRRLEAPDQVVPLIVEQGVDPDLDWLEIHKLRRKRDNAKPAEATLAAEQAILEYLERHPAGAAREAEIVAHVAAATGVGEATVKRSGKRLEEAHKITRSRRFGWSLASPSDHKAGN